MSAQLRGFFECTPDSKRGRGTGMILDASSQHAHVGCLTNHLTGGKVGIRKNNLKIISGPPRIDLNELSRSKVD